MNFNTDFSDISILLMTPRIRSLFFSLQRLQRGSLIVYITASDPDFEMSMDIMEGLPSVGVDVIELGMPFSDPMADGPILQYASKRALQAGGSLARTLTMVRAFRTNNNITPLILMGYYNPIYIYGVERFSINAALAGVDGCIIVDLPPEEASELVNTLYKYGIDFIFLATPTTSYSRLPIVLKQASGFIYYISITGITGTRSATQQAIIQAVTQLRQETSLPIAVGFGLNTPEQVAEVSSIADAAVVGSAIVQHISANLSQHHNLIENVLFFVRTLSYSSHKTVKINSLPTTL